MKIEDMVTNIQNLGYKVEHTGISDRGIVRFKVTLSEYYAEFLVTEEVFVYITNNELARTENFLARIEIEYKKWELQKAGRELPMVTESNFKEYFN